ncbi:putative MFS family arabinose efflux permease [Homoserinimonas aerilata]|uniref:Putative MFS family arabinose efflux permease n=1 Tax=Homoserinimonas aerilata TaxID=1162970 RepID=A0A542YIF5_9MICO|nr:MFS transporter [Homoserinimonas aerilata]TQL47879.1 putative MFS family arabinose efflux permease [Homoserinimonas aerilata]
MTFSLGRFSHPDASARLPRDVIVLGVIAFFVMVGFGVVVPVLPVFVRSFNVGYTEVGAVVAAFALMRLLVTPFVGRLIDRGGERTVLAIGIGIVAVSSGLVGVAQSYPELLLLRGAGGIGSAMFSVSAMTLLLGSASEGQRGRAMGFYQGGFLIGGMAGPAVGGVLAAISLRAPFFFYAGTLLLAGLVGLFLLQPPRSRVERHDTPRVPLGTVLRDRRFIAACLANFAQGWGSMGVRSALIPVLVVELLHETPTWTGIAFAIAAVAQTIALGPAGRFVDTIGRRPAIIAAYSAGAVLLMAIPFVNSLWLLIVLLCLYGVAAAFMGTAPAASVGDAAGPRNATPVALFSAFSDAGAIVGPLVAGALLDAFSYPAAFASAAVLMAAAALYGLRMPRAEASTRAGMR